MNFASIYHAKAFGRKIGATHYKNHDDCYIFIKESGAIHPIIPTNLIDEYMALETPLERLIALGHQFHCEADLIWSEKYSEWFAVTCVSSMSGLLRDEIGVIEL